jgi:thiamine monophosphate kinase
MQNDKGKIMKVFLFLLMFFFSISIFGFADHRAGHGGDHAMGAIGILQNHELLDGESLRVKGDIGKYNADYTITKNGDTITVKGDIGKYKADYTITKIGDTITVKGDIGKYRAYYTITKNGDTITVRGDVGKYTANYIITKNE